MCSKIEGFGSYLVGDRTRFHLEKSRNPKFVLLDPKRDAKTKLIAIVTKNLSNRNVTPRLESFHSETGKFQPTRTICAS